jgi:putative phosphoserine phosphatase/1-acylglycerol-3-phosphate O-acyltransferase
MALDKSTLAHIERLEAQRAEGTVVAFFDLDRTLIAGYSATSLVLECVRQGDEGFVRVAREILGNIDRRGGGRHYTALYKNLIHGLHGWDESRLRAAGEKAFQRHLEASLYREARQLVRRHRELGHRVVLVSAATSFQVEPVARALEVDAVYCTRLKAVDGVMTGEIDGVLCHGEGKVLAARRYARSQGAALADAWFYADSRDDLPLLKKVGHPVATNPTPALEEYARDRGWPVLHFCSRGMPNVESILRTALTANTLVTTAMAGAASWLLSRSPAKAANRMSLWLGDFGAALAGLDFEIEGAEHLESVRPAIFVFNHQSYLDSVVMAYLVRHDFVGFCKREMASNPILGPLLKAHGTIFVDRDAVDQSGLLEQAAEALRAGKSLVIAPEGTRSATGELLEFKKGAFYLAKKMHVPIVPVVLHNVSDAMPKGSLLLRPATIQVSVLPPLRSEQMTSLRHVGEELRERYRAVMRAPFGASGVRRVGGDVGRDLRAAAS